MPFRLFIATAQGMFFNIYFAAYLCSPKFCHRFVGYLEEEATRTYTVLLHHMDNGELDEWTNAQAPEEARTYYDLPASATFRDVILSVRADESMHREVNHNFADLGPNDDVENVITEIREMEGLGVKHKVEDVKI
jgi:hypothetical protein